MQIMKLVASVAIVLALGCARQETRSGATATATATAPAGEKTYAMTATIVSRDPAKNTLYLDNKEVPGEMAAMKMDYELRGAKVAVAPPDGSPVVVTVHDRDGSIWITDVKK